MFDNDVSELPKLFKLSLATFFSKECVQELPESHDRAIELFPKSILRRLRKSYKRKTRKVKLLWNLLMCKDLAARVPNSMIQIAYEKHRNTLTAVGETPDEYLEYFRAYCRDYCQKVKECFKRKTNLPPRRAYFNSKFSEGGCLNWHKKNSRISVNCHEVRSSGYPRIDPVVLHLFGKPGVGKSFLSTLIVSELSKRFGYKSPNFYARSSATDHWDGYNNQLISVIDDIFTERDDTSDCRQLVQLCSNLDYVLPMADLKDKGKKFSSDFLFLSSNYPWTVGNVFINNQPAIRRRIYPAYELLERKGMSVSLKKHNYDINTNEINPGLIIQGKIHDIVKNICDELITEHRKRVNCESIRIPLVEKSAFEPNISIRYPLRPPDRLPKVMAHAIPEPLKVRLITKGEEDLWVLKPVQKAMWEALKAYPCFQLTSNPLLPLDFMKSWKQKSFMLSGDYEAATDNLHMDVTQVMITELLKVLPVEFHDWIKWEGGIHEIHYPPSTGLLPCLQTKGQLMGSLLSFPILCVANAATIGMVQEKELGDLEALINGDDIVFSAENEEIQQWKAIASSIGLKPSIGKNYQSKDWCSINSQIIFRDRSRKDQLDFIWKPTGCFKALKNLEKFSQNFRKALEVRPNSLGQHIVDAKRILQLTPQSVEIPTEFGGLGDIFRREPKLEDKEIYFFKLLHGNFKKITEFDDYELWRIPGHITKMFGKVLGLSQTYELPSLEIEDKNPYKELYQVFNWKDFERFQKFYKTVPYLRDRIRNSNLSCEIPLNVFKVSTVLVPKTSHLLINNMKMRI